tara:strand:+ start:425 stop:706 length:282 start_codon:yes stop_codon:yes gene_type:complete
MKYDPIKKQLFTDKGLLIKRLHCPIKIQWNELKSNDLNNKNKLCKHCTQLIIDTSYYSDKKLYNMAQDNPNLCLKIDLNDNNIKLIAGEKYER